MDEESTFEEICLHWGEEPERFLGAIVPPLFQNSLFAVPSVEARSSSRYIYTREANPTTDLLNAKMAALEGTEEARCFASGMAAISAALLSQLRGGDHVVCVKHVYYPTRLLLQEHLSRFGVEVTFVQGTRVEDFEQALRPHTRVFYLESPTSINFWLQPLEEVCALARAHGVTTIIDNTWATPLFQRPSQLGVDIVVHSASKYLGGHSDVIAGVVCTSREHIEAIHREMTLLGGILDPFAAWLVLRGLRTLPTRLQQHQHNALQVAQWLSTHPAVHNVLYPGLPSHPQHELARRQMRGFSGLLSFTLKRNSREAAAAVVNALRLFHIGPSWGGYESLALPMRIEDYDGEMRWGLRIHVGLEPAERLIADLEQALRVAEG
ncbi:MAG: PLP-dependent aspartate aminotransferase family protein [Armatimonadota bacterium]|nr:PLP-dependent aspartate aminotransferase family protein [Armatimonadota bacterium]